MPFSAGSDYSCHPTCELIDHICTEPGDNKYTAKVTFGESDFTDVQTIHVSATEHTYDSGKTLLQAHCMRDGLKRHTCTLCHTKRDERVPCRGSHVWTAREVDYEELKEDDLQSSAHSHSDLNANGSSGKKYILKECKNCDTRLIEAPDGNMYVRFDQDSWSKDAANCASQSDVSALANIMASSMAEEVSQLGAAAGVAVSSQNVEAVLGASFALFAIAFTAIGVKFAISAVTGEGKSFDGWRENLKIITAEKDYQSTVYADAVYTPIFRFTTIRANYVDVFNNFIAMKNIGEEPPEPFSYEGYEFLRWDKEPTEIIEDGEKITALYRKVHDKVTINAEDCKIGGTVDQIEMWSYDSLSVDYDTYVTVSKEGAVYWTLNGKTVSYGESYRFLAETDVTLVPHMEPDEEIPLVEIISVKKISETDYRLEFIATRYVPENCQLIQAGFVCGKNMTEDDLNLDNVGKQGSQPDSGTVKVGYCESTGNNGEFSLTYGVKDQNAPAMARAFISCIDENGNVRILYSDMVTFNYQ